VVRPLYFPVSEHWKCLNLSRTLAAVKLLTALTPHLIGAGVSPVAANVRKQTTVPLVLVAVELCGLATANCDQGLPGSMPVWLAVLRCVDVKDSDTDALALHDYVESIAIDDMRHTTVERRGISVEREQQEG
jgi:hypothetical protein